MKFTWILIALTYTTLHAYNINTNPFDASTDQVLKNAYTIPSTKCNVSEAWEGPLSMSCTPLNQLSMPEFNLTQNNPQCPQGTMPSNNTCHNVKKHLMCNASKTPSAVLLCYTNGNRIVYCDISQRSETLLSVSTLNDGITRCNTSKSIRICDSKLKEVIFAIQEPPGPGLPWGANCAKQEDGYTCTQHHQTHAEVCGAPASTTWGPVNCNDGKPTAYALSSYNQKVMAYNEKCQQTQENYPNMQTFTPESCDNIPGTTGSNVSNSICSFCKNDLELQITINSASAYRKATEYYDNISDKINKKTATQASTNPAINCQEIQSAKAWATNSTGCCDAVSKGIMMLPNAVGGSQCSQ